MHASCMHQALPVKGFCHPFSGLQSCKIAALEKGVIVYTGNPLHDHHELAFQRVNVSEEGFWFLFKSIYFYGHWSSFQFLRVH